MVKCIKCKRYRKESCMQQAIFRDFIGDEPVPGIYKCASSASCKKARREKENEYDNSPTYDRT